MNNPLLQQALDRVSRRYRRVLLWTSLAACWLILALAGAAVLAWARGAGYAIPGAVLGLLVLVPAFLAPVVLARLRTVRSPLWIARQIEHRFADLDCRLLAALEQQPEAGAPRLGFLQQTVVNEALNHARRHPWDQLVSAGRLRAARIAHWATLGMFLAVASLVAIDMWHHPSPAGWWKGGNIERPQALEISVEPADTSLERGTALLVLARFKNGRLPGEVHLLYRDSDGQPQQMPMSRSLDDPLFAGRLASVRRDLSYAVRYGDQQTRWYKVSVFDYPEAQQVDARLKFPDYTKMPEKLVEDTRSITAVEGTRATLTFHLNKPVAQARLVPKPGNSKDAAAAQAPVNLVPDPADPSLYSAVLDLKQSQKLELQLVDKDQRANRDPAEFAINVTPNRPPDLKFEQPGHDVDVSPLQELTIKAKVWDDFGVSRVGLSYSLGGEAPKDVVLSDGIPGRDRREVTKLVSLEKLSAQPDQLLSYHLWAEDVGPDGKPRRTQGDMFFAEVRPFEQVFRQGQQQSQDQQQQQQQQQQAGQNAQQAEKLAELEKQIISATWKVIRRETAETPSDQLAPDVKLIGESQASAKEQASSLGERLTSDRSRAALQSVLKNMDQAIARLSESEAGPSSKPLPGALASEQAAYQDLLRLRAREFEVTRQNRQQSGQQSASSASARQQRQLDQLELSSQDNRYETQRSAAAQESPQQRETRQVLSRLRELAQRQEDLNKQMKELESALQKAQEQARRQELERQLARLRDQQQQMLRDTDELRDRMDRPENQERVADSRQQLEQSREDVRRASEQLQQGKLPEAAAAGQRASEQLGNLRDEFRKQAAGQFNEAMTQMRRDARELDQNQQDLSKRVAELADARKREAQPPTLRNNNVARPELAQDLARQKEQLEKLLQDMRKTVEEAENTEPLLSRQLYDSIRKTRQQQTSEALDASRQLLEQGLLPQARQTEGEAAKGITQLREGVERAANSVLGDQTEALRRAREEIDSLARQLDREMNRATGANGPTTRPSIQNRQLAQNTGDQNRNGQQPGERQNGQQQSGGRQNGQQQNGERQANGQASRQSQQQGQQASAQQGQRQQQGQGEQGQQQSGQQGQQGQRQQGQGQQASAQSGERQQRAQGQGQQQGQQANAQQGQQGQQQGQQGRQQGQQGQRHGQQGQQQGQQGQANARQPGEGQQPQPGQGQNQPGSRQGQAQQGSAQARGQRGNPQQGENAEQPGSEQQADAQQAQSRQGENARQNGQQRPGSQQAQARAGSLRPPTGPDPERDPRRSSELRRDQRPDQDLAPITGGGTGFREWSDRMRDVEEMVGDPRLRAAAARVRERVGAFRADFKRHSEPPNWDLVRETVGRPLYELRQAVSEELLRRESSEARVPIDREPVPPDYAEQVRRYYERLGSGK